MDTLHPRWNEYPTYYMLADQADSKKVKRRLTAHRFGAAVGHTKYNTPEQTADEISGIKKPELTDKDKENIALGVKVEPDALNWYADDRGVTIIRFNLCIPKWDKELACIPDGGVGDKGLISVKGPKFLYKSLIEHCDKVKVGWSPPPFYHNHIWDSHYDQMQGELAILDREWCDYLVYATGSQAIYTERVYRNVKYWENELYPGLIEFKEKLLKPRMGAIDIPKFNLIVNSKDG